MKDTIKGLLGVAASVAVITFTSLKVSDLYYNYSGNSEMAKLNRLELKNKITKLNPFKRA